MNNKHVTNKIEFFIVTRILVISAICFMIIAVFDAYESFDDEFKQSRNELLLTSEIVSLNIVDVMNELVKEYKSTMIAVKSELNRAITNRDRYRLIQLVSSTINGNSDVVGIGVYFKKNAFDGKDDFYINKEYHGEDGRLFFYVYNNYGIAEPEYETVYSEEEFNQAVKLNAAEITKFYKETYEDGRTVSLFSLAIPIIYNGERLGVISIDYDSKILISLLRTDNNYNAEFFLSDGKNKLFGTNFDIDEIHETFFNNHHEFKKCQEICFRDGFAEFDYKSKEMDKTLRYMLKRVSITDLIEFILITEVEHEAFQNNAKVAVTRAILFYIILLGIISVVLFLLIRIYITAPLEKITTCLKDISGKNGDLSVFLPVNFKAEFYEIAYYFNLTINKIRDSFKSLKDEISIMEKDGNDLSVSMEESASAISLVTKNIQDINRQTVEQAKCVEQTQDSVSAILNTVAALNKSIEVQGDAISRSSSAVEEMVASISSINTSVDNTTSLISSLSDATEDGKKIVEKSVSIAQGLFENSGELVETTNVIRHIAHETRILAMNAAIEAAHAGKYGQGFSVVAEEIRNLAEVSSRQGQIIASSMNDIKNQIAVLIESTQYVDQQFNEIYSLAGDVSKMGQFVFTAVQEQKVGTNEILSSVKNISQVTNDVKDGSEKLTRNGTNITDQMNNLTSLSTGCVENIHEISTGSVQLNESVSFVNKLAVKNKSNINNIMSTINKFKF